MKVTKVMKYTSILYCVLSNRAIIICLPKPVDFKMLKFKSKLQKSKMVKGTISDNLKSHNFWIYGY